MNTKHAGELSPHEACNPRQPDYRLPWIISALLLSMLISSLGQMIFSTALPTIVGELGGINHMSWVITGFILGQTVSLPIFGKLGDQIGRKGLFIGANMLFIIGSAVGGAATNMGMLIAARCLQGIAAGGMMTLSQAITAEVTTARERGKYMGLMGAVFAVSSVLGPVLGGWFTDDIGWRWGLWLNIPLGVIAVVAIAYALKLPKRETKLDIDWFGIMTMTIATASLVLFVTWGGNEYEWSDPLIIGLGIVAVVIGLAFVLVELRRENPLIPMQLFKVLNFTLTTAAGFGIGVFMFGTMAYLPTYLQMVHAMTPTSAGLMMICMMMGLMATSISVGRIVSRTGKYKWFPVLGLYIVAVGLFLFSTLNAETSLVVVGIYLFIFGFGLGLAMQVLVLIAQNSFSVKQVGTVTATNNFFRQIGGCIGAALVGGLFTSNLTTEISEKLPKAIQQAGPEAASQLSALQGGGASRLTPELVASLPHPVVQAIEFSYNNALTPIFALLLPLAIISGTILIWIRGDKLKETID